jgi:hypothetical protein
VIFHYLIEGKKYMDGRLSMRKSLVVFLFVFVLVLVAKGNAEDVPVPHFQDVLNLKSVGAPVGLPHNEFKKIQSHFSGSWDIQLGDLLCQYRYPSFYPSLFRCHSLGRYGYIPEDFPDDQY